MSNRADEQLINYCDLHCKTPRALFHKKHVNRMLELAGHSDGTEPVYRIKDAIKLHAVGVTEGGDVEVTE